MRKASTKVAAEEKGIDINIQSNSINEGIPAQKRSTLSLEYVECQ
jgi:hypothetical protein